MNEPTVAEKEVRRLRDIVYDAKTTDKNWDYCKVAWAQDIEWLREMAIKTVVKS